MHLQHLDHANVIHYSIWKIKWHAVFTLQKLSLISLTKWIPLWVIVKVPLGLGVLSSWIKYFWMPSGPGQPPYWAIRHPCTKAWLFSNLNYCPSEAKSLFWVYSCYFLNFLNTYMWVFFFFFYFSGWSNFTEEVDFTEGIWLLWFRKFLLA